MKLTKTSIPIGFMLLQVLGAIWYGSLYDIDFHSHTPIKFIVLILFLAFNAGVIVVFMIVYYFYREKKKIWQMPFYLFLLSVGLSLLIDFLETL